MKFYNFTRINYNQADLDRETASVFGDFKP